MGGHNGHSSGHSHGNGNHGKGDGPGEICGNQVSSSHEGGRHGEEASGHKISARALMPGYDIRGFNHEGMMKGTSKMPWLYHRDAVVLDELLGGPEEFGEMPLSEETADHMRQWLTKNEIVEYVPRGKDVGVVIPLQGRREIAGASNVGTTLLDADIDVPLNDIGKKVSQWYDVGEALKGFMISYDGLEMVYARKGLGGGETISKIGVGKFPSYVSPGFIFAIGRHPDTGEIMLIANEHWYKMIEDEVEAFQGYIPGLTVEQRLKAIIAEELVHYDRGSFDKPLSSQRRVVKEEEATKEEVLDFYHGLIKGVYSAEDRASLWRTIGTVEHDLATVDRYYEKDADEGKPHDGHHHPLENRVEDGAFESGADDGDPEGGGEGAEGGSSPGGADGGDSGE